MIELLKHLIEIPSVSRDEAAAADFLFDYCAAEGLRPQRFKNNIVLGLEEIDPERPTVLLNAHIDTVKPGDSWTREPFRATLEGDRLYGLGANDCGGGLVALLEAYKRITTANRLSTIDYRQSTTENRQSTIVNRPPAPQPLAPFNLLYVASAEEEVGGKDGFEYVRQFLPKIDVAIVGEPTCMQPAIAEKGLMVVDMTSHGKAGHAARNEGVNAIYEALDDILWLKDYRFEKVSPLLGETKMTLTVINAGRQHNVVPDRCEMVIDVRTNELYTNEEVFGILQENIKSELRARSFRLSSSHISEDHPFIKRLKEMGKQPFGSPTLSDQALMPWPSFKLGPGDSARSHTADEYIKIPEIEDAVETYLKLLS